MMKVFLAATVLLILIGGVYSLPFETGEEDHWLDVLHQVVKESLYSIARP